MLFRWLIALFCISLGGLTAENLHVFGTFDYNKNGKSEILKLKGLVASLEMVELGNDGSHHTLWSYSPQPFVQIVDVKFNDLNQDSLPELIVLQSGDPSGAWLKVFEWNGVTFSPSRGVVTESFDGKDTVRPSNLAVASDVFAIAMSTPDRSAGIFSISMNEGVPKASGIDIYSPSLVSNGYGPVYVGLITKGKVNYACLISPESDLIKVSLLSLSDTKKAVFSDLFVTNGARGILGPDIRAFDENKDGVNELIIPFATGEVFAVAISDSGVSFEESRLNQSGLFSLKSGAGETEINKKILSRIESGLYEAPLWIESFENNDSLLLLVNDTLMLGDTLNSLLLSDSTSSFHRFKWKSVPPPGMRFNPTTYSLEWIPRREHIGVSDVSYAFDVRQRDTLVSGSDALGDNHQILPVLESRDSSFVILVGDTIKPREPILVLPPRYHRVQVTSKDINDTDRFTFTGEAPFSATSSNINDIVTVGVSTNLSSIKQDKTAAFTFKSSENKPDSIITLSLVHDLKNNTFYASIYPSSDSLTQSFDPAGWKTKLSSFPEYFFEGFPNNMALDSLSNSGLSLLSAKKKMSGSITLYSPLPSQDHKIVLKYFGGRPHALRGDINVREKGYYRTLAEIDFEKSFTPLSVSSLLSPVSRDTFLFHEDSLPDTLRASMEYRSFYAPVTILDNLKPGSRNSLYQAEADSLRLGLDTLNNINKTPTIKAAAQDSTK